MKKNVSLVLSNKDTKFLFKIFRYSDFELRYVGGCVRDALLKKKSDDIDFSTNAKPHEMQQIFRKNNVHYFDSGLKHGTITAIFNRTCYEITTLRHDIECDGRHAKVEYTKSWELDAARRDFTFNALYCDETGKIYDYFDGIEDLKNKKLRFIGNCRNRIQEDYLRILRAFRFNNRYCDGNFDKETIDAFNEFSEKISILSGERIQQEVTKLIFEIKKENIRMLEIMNFTGISKFVFNKKIDFQIVNEIIDFDICDVWSRLAILFRYNKVEIDWIKNRWNLSKINHRLLKKIFEMNIPKDFLNMQNKYFYIFSEIKDVFLFCCLYEKILNFDQYEQLKKEWQKKENLILPITNQDIIKIGISGKMIGESLKFAENQWLENDCQSNKEELVEILKKN